MTYVDFRQPRQFFTPMDGVYAELPQFFGVEEDEVLLAVMADASGTNRQLDRQYEDIREAHGADVTMERIQFLQEYQVMKQ